MKLARIGEVGRERPAVFGPDGTLLDMTSVVRDIDGDLLAGGLDIVRAALERGTLDELPSPRRYGPPVGGIGKVVCVGLNYRDHATETGAALPDEPVLFLKASDTVIGPDDDVLVPRRSERTDYEVELAVVIGRGGGYLRAGDTMRLEIDGLGGQQQNVGSA